MLLDTAARLVVERQTCLSALPERGTIERSSSAVNFPGWKASRRARARYSIRRAVTAYTTTTTSRFTVGSWHPGQRYVLLPCSTRLISRISRGARMTFMALTKRSEEHTSEL